MNSIITNNLILDYKIIYNHVIKQLKQFNLYNKDGVIIKFQKEALIG
jgi:hypothetical protein